MDDLIQIFISVLVGVAITIFTIKYTLMEGDRWRINQCIESVGTEINNNKSKFILFNEDFEKGKLQWNAEKIFDKKMFKWNLEISITEQGAEFGPFKFDAFNYYKNSGIPCLVGIGLDYRLTELYSAFKNYNYTISQSQKKINQLYTEKQFDQIDIELKKIEAVSNDFVQAFTKFANCFCTKLEYVKYVRFGKIKFWNWHLYRTADLNIVFSDRDYYKEEYEKFQKERR